MADLTIEHDPDSGCPGCPFFRIVFYDYRSPDEYRCGAEEHPRAPYADGESATGMPPAGPACPIRTARVVVQQPGSES